MIRFPGIPLAQPGLRIRFQRGLSWNLVSAVFTQGSAFLANVIIARLLGQLAFGEYGMLQSTLVTMSGLAQLAATSAAGKYVAEFRATNKVRTGRILGLCAVVTLITGAIATGLIILGAPWLAAQTLRVPHLAKGLSISAGYILFSVMNGYQMGALAGLEEYKSLAILGSIHAAFHIAFSFIGAAFYGLNGALVGFSLSAAARWYLFGIAVRNGAKAHDISITYRNISKERTLLFRFALPAALSGLSSYPAIWISRALLAQQEEGYMQLALFSAAYSLKNLVVFAPGLINNVGTSLLNSQRGQRNAAGYRSVFWSNMVFTSIAALTVSLGVLILSPWLLRAFGAGFVAAWPALMILLAAGIIESIGLAIYQVIKAEEIMWFSLFFIAMPRDAILVLVAYYLSPSHGASGLAMAHAASLLYAFLAMMCAARYLDVKMRDDRGWTGPY